MKKFLPIILVGVVLLGLAVGGWFFLRGRTGSGDEVTNEAGASGSPAIGDTEEMSLSGKLEDLLSLGKAVKCTWQDMENNIGVAFVKGNNIYTESTVNGVKNYFVQRDDCTWVWQEGQAQGYKMCVEPEEDEEPEETELPQDFSMNAGTMNYTCVPQVINDSRFEVPGDIQFVDFAQIIQMNLPELPTIE